MSTHRSSSTKPRHHRRKKVVRHIWRIILISLSILLLLIGAGALWVATLDMPDLNSFNSRKIVESTKIYDRTGTILLYDTGTNTKRTVVPLSSISPLIQKGAIAIEDSNFYTNIGIEPLSILRAAVANIASGGYDQGASTITQQVIKNALLTQDKTISRKLKEWFLAVKLTRMMSKDQILETYLNETSYGGTIFGVEEACQEFFGKSSKDVDLAQAAYIAAIPQAPSYYSPYSTHRSNLDTRQKLVLLRMKDLGMISADEYKSAVAEKVVFLSKNSGGIRAPHFVMAVKDYLTQKYGDNTVTEGGLKVITTLDYDMQQKAEDTITRFAPTLSSNFNASNTAMVAIDPKTGDILTMVGSRDYFDQSIDGNFNIALAERQPGSTFKPFVYATAFEKGFTPETELFDIPTQFSTWCNPAGTTTNAVYDSSKACYMPGEYDHNFEGPMSARFALAQSRNIPAVQMLYLAGMPQTLKTVADMGVTSLTDPNRYGLTMVLGGGEVSLLEMTSAYGVFANDGVRNPYRYVLEVDDNKGNVLEKASLNPTNAIQPEAARQISSILSDNNVRMTSLKPIMDSIGRTVAVKTGTTNDYRDVWTVGYTPNLVVGAWAGNNDNSPMKDAISALIITPVWGAFMSQVAKNFPPEDFKAPPPPLTDNKPVLRGVWQGGASYWKDSISGKVATAYTPAETRQEVIFNGVHSILYWLDKNNPQGPAPTNPSQDPQYENWEYAVRTWFLNTWKPLHPEFNEATSISIPTETDDIHTPANMPTTSIISPTPGSAVRPQDILKISLSASGKYPIQKSELYLNGKYVMSSTQSPLNLSFVPSDIGGLQDTNTVTITSYDSVLDKITSTTTFSIAQ